MFKKRDELQAQKAERTARDDTPTRQFEFKALNLDKIPGMALEDKLNEWGAKGYEVRAEVKGYAVLQREIV